MISNLPLTWNNKKNSPLLADFIAKYGAEYCMTAEEINQLRDAVNEMGEIQKTTFLGVAEPADVPTGTGRGYWEVITPGTYTYFGGKVLGVDERGLISRDAVGGFKLSKVAFSFSTYAKKTDLQSIDLSNYATTTLVYSKTNKSDLFKVVYNLDEYYTAIYPENYYNSSGVLQSLAGRTALNIIDCKPNDIFTIIGLNSINFSTTQGRFLSSTGAYLSNIAATNYSAVLGGYKITIPSTSTIAKIALYFDNQYLSGKTFSIKKNNKIVSGNDFTLNSSLFDLSQTPNIIATIYKNYAATKYVGFYFNGSGTPGANANYYCIDMFEVTGGEYISIKNMGLPDSALNWFRLLDSNNSLVETITTNSLEKIGGGYRLKIPLTSGIAKLAFWWDQQFMVGDLEVYKSESLHNVNKVLDKAIKDNNSDGLAAKFYQRGNIIKPTQLAPCFLMAGQSNQEGRLELIDLPSFWTSNSNKLTDVLNINTDDGIWHEYNATNYSVKNGVTQFSYEIMLLKMLIDYRKSNGTASDKIYTVKKAIGGTSIAALGEGSGRWTPEFEKIPNGVPFLLKDLETRYRTAKSSANGSLFTPNGMIWHQGEGDREFAEDYYNNMKFVAWYIRGFTNTPEFPIVVGGINSLSTQYNYDVEQAKIRLASEDSFIFYAPVSNIQGNLKSDGVHFNYAGGNELATNIYNIMVANYKIFGLK
jgi:hypothetical protein